MKSEISLPDLLVIGAGPAGIAAACAAAERGQSVTVVDENPGPGGQIWRNAENAPPDRPADRWIKRLLASGATLHRGAVVFAFPERGLALAETATGTLTLPHRRLLLATGAREIFLPFPGWTLPNVLGAGGLQALLKGGLDLRGKRVAVAGSGPLLLAVAAYLKKAGAIVPVIAEQAPWSALFRFGTELVAHPGKVFQSFALGGSLIGVPFKPGTWPVEAKGTDTLASVRFRTASGAEFETACDYLACGFGLVPQLELPRLLGCAITPKDHVQVDDFQETSVEDIYCAGEPTGVGGLDLALLEGDIAGRAIAGDEDGARELFPARLRARAFARSLDRAFALRPEVRNLAKPDTIVCRCEDATHGQLQNCLSARDARLQHRCGMGPCQGRVCGAACQILYGWEPGTVRPPIHPVRVSSLLEMAKTGEKKTAIKA